jgi:hypothetical protein
MACNHAGERALNIAQFPAKRKLSCAKLAGGPAFDLVDTIKTVGAPLFALFEGRVPRVPTAGDSALHPHVTRSRNEISLHSTFTCTNPLLPTIVPITAPPPLLRRFH